jgi:glutaredoxin
LLLYATLAVSAWNPRADSQWKTAWVLSVFGVLYSLYLTGVSFFILDAACPYCLTSLALMTAIFITVVLQRPKHMPRFSWRPWLTKTVGGTLVAVLALHLYYAGYWGRAPRPEDPWVRGLAEHLAKSEVKFYGTYWCPHCNDQKELFGESAKRLPYVECSPGGASAPQAAECKEKNIQSYPTWIINGQRLSGTQSLDALAQASKYNHQGGNP